MAEPLVDQIIDKIKQVKELYHRLLLVVASAGAGKTSALRDISNHIGAPMINLNLELSRRLLDLTERQRSLQIPRLLSDIVASAESDIVLLDNIEILFDLTLQQDPLRLLQSLSRNKTVIAAWNGSIDREHITYATAEHSEYRRYPAHDFLVVSPEVMSLG